MNPCRCGGGRRARPYLPARPALRGRLPGAHLRPAARPHRHPHRGAGARRRRPDPPRRQRNRAPRWRERVAAARDIQVQRYAGARRVESPLQRAGRRRPDRDVADAGARRHRRLLEDAAEAMRLSARGYHRVLKLARTLADLDGAETVARIHIAEALELPRAAGGAGARRRLRRPVGLARCGTISLRDHGRLASSSSPASPARR